MGLGHDSHNAWSCLLRGVGAAALCTSALYSEAQASQSATFAVSLVLPAVDFKEFDCPTGLNFEGKPGVAYEAQLKDLGYAPENIEKIMSGYVTGEIAPATANVLIHRGRLDGAAVNAFARPLTTIRPPIKYNVGGRAIGFNLNDKKENGPTAFEDPETHESGVDNQFVRATGCIRGQTATYPSYPTEWEYPWTFANQSVTWIITVSAESFSQDGPASVSFKRSIDRAYKDANGKIRSHSTFRLDTDPQWHGEFQGFIKDGVFESSAPTDLRMKGDPLWLWQFYLAKARLRLDLRKSHEQIAGIVGGYQPFADIYGGFGEGGVLAEQNGTDLPLFYRAMSEMADHDPDPVTKQNRSISIAYRIEAVPAFAVSIAEANQMSSNKASSADQAAPTFNRQ